MARAKKERALDLSKVLSAIDRKDRNFDQNLTEEELKEFSTYTSMRWAASVEGDPTLQEYYLRSANERVNLNFFDLSQHPKLQWLLCTTVSPGMGKQKHYWVGSKSSKTKLERLIEEHYPHLNTSEIELMAQINNEKDFADYLQSMGWDDKDIKKAI